MSFRVSELWPFGDMPDPVAAAAAAKALAVEHIRAGADLSAVLADAYQCDPSSSTAAARAAYVGKLVELAQSALPAEPPTAKAVELFPWTDERKLVCLEASWELDALGNLLPAVMPRSVDFLSETMQVRSISARLRTLAGALMKGLGDDMVPTAELAKTLGLNLETNINGAQA